MKLEIWRSDRLVPRQKDARQSLDHAGGVSETASAYVDFRLAKEEEDPLDRYPPIIRYLQKLGPDYLSTIFDFSKWIFAEDPARGLGVSKNNDWRRGYR